MTHSLLAQVILSLRLALDGSETTLEEATHRVAEAAARHGKAWGMAGGNGEDWRRWRAMDAQLLIGSGDFALTNFLKEAQEAMDQALDPLQQLWPETATYSTAATTALETRRSRESSILLVSTTQINSR